ncbi:hypothetical protein [Nocardia grenadensis]|uniref:hypothetical protein n=1 Tax=Nocardia grenadensis TaxID=931537 RepID=UPI0007A56465|nr:hypothetical protein [Nocardia grenadensis]
MRVIVRTRAELGRQPRVIAIDALLREFLDALRERRGGDTPPPAPDAGGVARHRAGTSGGGGRDPVDDRLCDRDPSG